MKKEHRAKILEKFKNEILPPLIEELKSQSEALRDKEIEEIGNLTEELATVAFIELFRVSGAKEPKEFDKDFMNKAMIYLISAFNSALALDHTYICAALHIGPSPKTAKEENLKELGELDPICLVRKMVPGIHDCLNPAVAIICFVDSPEDAEDGLKLSKVWSLNLRDPRNKNFGDENV